MMTVLRIWNCNREREREKKTKPSMKDMRNEKWKVKTTKQNNSNNHKAFYLYSTKSSQIEWLRHLKTFLLLAKLR